MNYVIRELTLYRHFLLIDSPIPFEFIANPTNYNKDMSDFSRVTGLDVCSRPSGCWRVDCWKLLPKEFQRNNPVFTMLLKYDADLLHEGEVVDVRYSDIDVGEGVAGVNGQLVQILPSTFQPVVNAVDSLRELNSDGFDSLGRSIGNADVNNVNGFNAVKDSVDALQTSNHADLLGVKNSVDALQTSNHADLLGVKNSVDALVDLDILKKFSFFNEVGYINVIPVSNHSGDTFVRFSPVFFDTFISLRYSTYNVQHPNLPHIWHDNWIFIPRGVRFIISVRIDNSIPAIVFTVTYPVNGVDVSTDYRYDAAALEYSVNGAVPLSFV